MNSYFLKALVFFAVCILTVNAQQWAPQQLAAYRQQYYNWWYNQQRMQQVQQQPQFQQQQFQQAPATQAPSSMFGNAQSDSKGNSWHGDDNAKFFLVARSSWP